jgi:alginate O-acetyltransferase complex protein AlgI
MEITSITLVFSVIISLFVFYLIPGKLRIIFLVVISSLFIASYSLGLMTYVWGYGLVNYLFGIYLFKVKQKKKFLWIGIVFNLLQLILLKYHTFLFDPVFKVAGLNSSFFTQLTDIIVPIGVSFFTLQGIGYLINISKGWEKPETNFFHFLLYIIFFPKFLSGPIERSNQFLPQLKNNFRFDDNHVTNGLWIALFGFFKKIVVANQLGLLVNAAYRNIEHSSSLSLWVILFLQPFYLYFDFSAYTDIAIGFSKAFGINLSQNFKRPFFAENISTFWRRFHMSLTNWFNDYVFRQVSFKLRKWGIYASVFAVFVTFTLFGIWHGAGWNFMALGFIQAVAINYEFFTKKYRIHLFSKVPDLTRIWISRLITFCFFSGSLVFFFSPNLHTTFMYFSQLFSNFQPFDLHFTKSSMFAIFLLLILIIIELLNNDYLEKYNKILGSLIQKRWLRISVYYVLIVLIIKYLGGDEVFIYQMF